MSKERLDNSVLNNAISTYKTVVEVAGDIIDEDYSPVLDKVTLAFLEELKQYRDLEEQGLLLRLPCKVGDTVYILADTMVVESTCKGFEMRNNDWRVVCSVTGYSVTYERFGSVFTTRAEAEEKLRELEGK